jgi:molybdopterin-guanine dinucleotide biosynthesis protein A
MFAHVHRMKADATVSAEICILAGGLSRRMGRDKSRLPFGGRTMLAHIRATAGSARLPVRVLRRDLVACCGPLGGVYTALRTTKADAVLFLACDMPFVTRELLLRLLGTLGPGDRALFARLQGRAGFPFVLRRDTLAVVFQLIEQERFSLRELSRELKSKFFRPPVRLWPQLRNINTPNEWAVAVKLFQRDA